jgi:hypothetical protein
MAEIKNPIKIGRTDLLKYGKRGSSLPIGATIKLSLDGDAIDIRESEFKNSDGDFIKFPTIHFFVNNKERFDVALSSFAGKSVSGYKEENNALSGDLVIVDVVGLCPESANYEEIYDSLSENKDKEFVVHSAKYWYDSQLGGKRSSFIKAIGLK